MKTLRTISALGALMLMLFAGGCGDVQTDRGPSTLPRGIGKSDTTSCENNCGKNAGSCWCDDKCSTYGDCCSDFVAECQNKPEPTCAGSCGKKSPFGCWCDDKCAEYGDCCDDKAATCDGGCNSDLECAADEFCDFPHNACDTSLVKLAQGAKYGTCEKKPTLCTREFKPVCGCDGKTYGNACNAKAAGQNVVHEGPCPDKCATDSDCKAGQFCEFKLGQCEATMPAFNIYGPIPDPAKDGECVTKPQACTEQYQPVCGCDGVTYGNACFAKAAGANVVSQGECATTCNTNADCQNSWCSCADASCSTRECRPYQVPGGSCGGFTLPHMQQACDPDHTCVMRPFIADAPGKCAKPVSFATLMADPKAYAGQVVAVEGDIQTQPALCTKAACGPANPCCNSCGASQVLVGSGAGDAQLHLEKQNGTGFGCSGNNCNYMQNCTANDAPYQVIGTVVVQSLPGSPVSFTKLVVIDYSQTSFN